MTEKPWFARPKKVIGIGVLLLILGIIGAIVTSGSKGASPTNDGGVAGQHDKR